MRWEALLGGLIGTALDPILSLPALLIGACVRSYVMMVIWSLVWSGLYIFAAIQILSNMGGFRPLMPFFAVADAIILASAAWAIARSWRGRKATD